MQKDCNLTAWSLLQIVLRSGPNIEHDLGSLTLTQGLQDRVL